MAGSEGNSTTFDVSRLLLLLPLFGSAVAVSYDVGYFYGLDIEYFTLFSFSAHLVFALQALPFGIAAIVILGTTTLSYRLGYIRAKPTFPNFDPKTASEEEKSAVLIAIEKKRKRGVLSRSIVSVVMMSAGLILVWFGWLTTGFILATFSVLTYASDFLPKEMQTRQLVVSFIAFCLLVFSFATGSENVAAMLADTRPRQMVKLANGELTGRIVRSGDRGILFYDMKEKKIELLIWDDVKKITSLPH